VRHTLLSTLLLATLLAPQLAQAQQEQEIKPMMVISVRSYNQLITDLDTLGEISDMPGLGMGLDQLLTQFTQGQGIPGLDKDKPWGMAISSSGFDFQILGFLPTNKLDDFMELVGQFAGDVEKQEDGVYQVVMEGLPLPLPIDTVYFKQHGDWTYASIFPTFGNLPDDPTTFLEGMEKDYHIAARVHFSNIPDLFRQMAVEQLRAGVEEGLGGLPGVSGGGVEAEVEVEAEDGDVEVQAEVEVTNPDPAVVTAREQVDALASLLNDTDYMTFGWKLDAESRRGMLDIIVKQREESLTDSAGLLAGGADKTTTRFHGFANEKATIAANVSMPLGESEKAQAKQLIDGIREQLLGMLGGTGQLDEGTQDFVDDFFGEAFGLVHETIDNGKLDMGFSVMGKGPFTIFGGVHLTHGDKAERLIERLVTLVEDELGFFGIEREKIEGTDITLYTTFVPALPDGEIGDQLFEMFGENIELVMGAGEHSLYLGLGAESIDMVKNAIQASADAEDKTISPVEATVSIGPLLKLMAAAAEDSEAGADNPLLSLMNLDLAEISDQMEEGKDRIFITVKPIEAGIHTHVEMEEGLIKSLGNLMMTLATGGLPGLSGGL